MVDLSCNPPLILGNCDKFNASFRRMENVIPEGTKGNGNTRITPPYGVTPFCLPRIPYEPKTVSLNRGPWENWRYGSNYMNTDGVEKPYGYPDYTYYRENYCGPCCSCVSSIAPLAGDPNGKNPNIRYVQLDFKNLLGSGFATQGPPTSQTSPFLMGNAGAATSCGQNHCPDCSGVYKKKEQPVKFQVCIGNPTKPETVQPCPVQPMKVYVPLSMMPRGGPDGDKQDPNEQYEDERTGKTDNCQAPILTSMRKQQYEVIVPGQEHAYNQQTQQGNCNGNVTEKTYRSKSKPIYDPCGCCKACKTPVRNKKTTCVEPGRCQIPVNTPNTNL